MARRSRSRARTVPATTSDEVAAEVVVDDDVAAVTLEQASEADAQESASSLAGDASEDADGSDDNEANTSSNDEVVVGQAAAISDAPETDANADEVFDQEQLPETETVDLPADDLGKLDAISETPQTEPSNDSVTATELEAHMDDTFTSEPVEDRDSSGDQVSEPDVTVSCCGEAPAAPPQCRCTPCANTGHAAHTDRAALDGFSVTAMIAGIASFFVPVVGSIFAILFGVLGLNRTKNGAREGRGYAIAGIALGGLTATIVLTLAVVIGVVTVQAQAVQHSEQKTAEVAANQFSQDLVTSLSTGNPLPITKLDAGKLLAASSTVPSNVSLVDWRKTPGQDRACFTVQTTNGASRSAIVTGDEFSMGRSASFQLLAPNTNCPTR